GVDRARRAPRQELRALDQLARIGAGIAPGADRSAREAGQMRAAAEGAPELPRQRSDVVTAAHDEPQPARARQIVPGPAGLVQIHAHWGQLDLLASVRPRVRALPTDALVAGGGRDLLAPAEE